MRREKRGNRCRGLLFFIKNFVELFDSFKFFGIIDFIKIKTRKIKMLKQNKPPLNHIHNWKIFLKNMYLFI